MKLYTVGYAGTPFPQLVQALQAAGCKTLVDVRHLPWSQSQPSYREEEMAQALPEGGISYVQHRELGNHLGAECKAAGDLGPYRQLLQREPQRLRRLTELLAREPAAILCGCYNPHRCHRGVIADQLRAQGVEVVHLQPERAQVADKIAGLTVHHPWVWALQHHTPLVNLLVSPPLDRGRWIAVHAAKDYDGGQHLDLNRRGLPLPPRAYERHHGIVAVGRYAELLRCRETPTADHGGDPWFWGPVAVRLVDLTWITPVPCRGSAGLWRIPAAVLGEVRAAWKAARKGGS